MVLDSATMQVLQELDKQREKNHVALVRATMREMEREDRPTVINESEVRPGMLNTLLKRTQQLFLSKEQTKALLKNPPTLEIYKVPLRERVLKPGEVIILLTEEIKNGEVTEGKYWAEVINSELCTNITPNKRGLTNIVLKVIR